MTHALVPPIARVQAHGLGTMEPHRGLGGNALLYAELYHTLIGCTQYQHSDVVQMQEANTQMLGKLEALNVRRYKTHRVYLRPLVVSSISSAKETTN